MTPNIPPPAGQEFATARQALAACQEPGAVVLFRGRYYVTTDEEAERLQAAGAELAYVCLHQGRVVTVPVN